MDDLTFHLQGEGWFWPRGRADDEWAESGRLWFRSDGGRHSGVTKGGMSRTHCEKKGYYIVDITAFR